MTTRIPRSIVLTVATVVMAFPFISVSGQMPVRAPRYAITNAKIVTASGPIIEKGTVVMRDGVIEMSVRSSPPRPMRSSSTAPGSSSIPG